MSAIFGETLIFGQQNGPDIELRVFGDEFYARYETLQGYTVVYDLDLGKYCYAALDNGHFVSSGAPVSKPVPSGLRRNLKESGPVRNQKFNQRYTALRLKENFLNAASNVMRTYGPNSGLLAGRQLPIGQVRGLTILVDFPDLETSITADDVTAMLNEPDFSAHGNYCSIRKYYEMMSSGRLTYTNQVVGPVRLSQQQSYYINNLLVPEAIELAMSEHHLDPAAFDSRGEGFIDALNVMYAGRSMYAGDLWPHNAQLNLRIGGHRTNYYTIQSLGRNRIDLSIGTFAHESGHMLCRFPDLYDYGERDGDFEESSGLGQYCLMSWGNHLNGGKTPSPVCAYLRDLAGWCTREISLNRPGEYRAEQADYGTLLKYSTGKSHEYFILENRLQNGLDEHLPDAGLAIYHCDTRGSNEYQDGTPDRHFQCALVQADGRLDLERSTGGGDEGDLYARCDGVALADTTVPNAKQWDGAPSGMLISDVRPSESMIFFTAGEIDPPHRVSETVVADLIIPDNNPEGVASTLSINQPGRLSKIAVTVDITHTYRGDLYIRLASPSGKSIDLHRDKGGSLDNLHLDLNSDQFAPLAELAGEDIQGEWKLRVSDLFKDDVGRLDKWGLTIDFEPGEQVVTGSVEPNLDIPDMDENGIVSIISISETGTLAALSVDVDISHTYRGDLRVELISPRGGHALICDNNGDSADDIRQVYSMQTTPALKTFIGEQIRGDWRLHVRDLARDDQGKLNRWALSLKMLG